MSKLLAAVTKATRRRTHADQAYREAIENARQQHTLEEIGRAAGLTKQGVRYLLHPDPRKAKT
jgi:hypothetical protein